MEYICHRRYKKTGASGKEYNFRRGTKLETISNFIALNDGAVCSAKSLDAFQYFSRNDDGRGLERGDLTYAIAFSPRKPNKDNDFRFTDKEREMLCKEYKHFLKDMDFIVFNYDFFNAEIEELQKLADRLFGKGRGK